MPVRRGQADLRKMPGALLPETAAGTGTRNHAIFRPSNDAATPVAGADAHTRQVPQSAPPDGTARQPAKVHERAAFLISSSAHPRPSAPDNRPPASSPSRA